MPNPPRLAPAVISAALLAAVAIGGVAAQQRARPAGYLATGAFDLLRVLPAAPRPGDPLAEADRAVFRGTRALAGTPSYTARSAGSTSAAATPAFSSPVGLLVSNVCMTTVSPDLPVSTGLSVAS